MAKFILVLILMSSTQLFSKSFAQVEMTLNFKNRTLKEALKTIEQKSDYYFLYDEQITANKTLISVDVKDALIDDVMRQVLSNTNFTYELSKKLVIISPKSGADKIAITGQVKDSNGNPLPGVAITQKNKSNSTTTNANGQFSINVDESNAVLVFSFLGFKTQEVKIDGRTVINVVMNESLSNLNEVVVVGYGTQIRQNVTSSIGSISQKDIKDLPLTNIGQALQGKISGLQLQQTGGAPGSSPVFRVRGLGSLLAGNGPLIVLDGQALNSGDLNLINPADIESVDVLKDASATAIYGSRGANGVVLITTKKGKSGQPRIDVNYYTALQEVTKKLPVLNRDEFIAFSKDAYQNAFVDRYPLLDPNTPNSARPNNLKYPEIFDNPSALPDNNYQDLIFQTAPLNNIGVSASGGNDKTIYLLSGNFTNQQGIIKTSELKRYSFRSNLESKLTKNLNVGVNISPTYTNERLVNSDNHWQNYGIINAAIELFPWLPLYQADGVSYNSAQAYNKDPYYYAGVTNPVANITEINTRQTTSRLLGNAFAEYSFLKGFKYRASIGTDIQQGRINNFQTSKLPRNGQLPPNVANSGYNTTVQNVNWIFTQTLDYNKTFNNKHNLGVLIGTEAQANSNEYSDIRANNFPNDNVSTLNAGTITSATTLKEEWALASYFSRVSYNYDSKYLLNVSLRYDGSSRFGSNNRYGFFPAVSAGWNIAQENFLKDSKLINTLKLKGSYGLAGNNAFGNYQSLGLLSKANYVLANKQVNGLAVS
ncbi:MAG TPA: SusC/RagA family TonB-linked outer membrane protein, partial [Pelobium sp.]